MKRFVVGDIHGNFKAFKQCLEKSRFDYNEDELVCLGDVCDGHPEVVECFDELMKVKKLIFIIGNHDKWAYDFYTGATDGHIEPYWIKQGGASTFDGYTKIGGMPAAHLEILKNAHVAFEESVNGLKRLFVHGGIDPNQRDLTKQDPENCMWDRSLFENARKNHNNKSDCKYGGYDEIFVGHTSTESYDKSCEPMHVCNVWNLDTGAGWTGKLTMMNIETKEVFQSEKAGVFYPSGGRKILIDF